MLRLLAVSVGLGLGLRCTRRACALRDLLPLGVNQTGNYQEWSHSGKTEMCLVSQFIVYKP